MPSRSGARRWWPWRGCVAARARRSNDRDRSAFGRIRGARFERGAIMIPSSDKIAICFAHVAYQLHERFSALGTGINSFAVRAPEALEDRVGEADVLVISGLWQDKLLDRAKRLRFIQAIGAGTDQFPREELAK